ncbi:N-acetylmuramoyl-L-alanine amidase [Candidatus Peregrinibacteria bacterium]|nr:N-acetylmuramoyl-L-alanine amidase [Candidatus Peregrinibacteria bacterium]MBI3816035.1 N-acetylmuramoyl-L-alanine amidase [Candidatus Peregrinibacteria bacterium]
MRLRSCAVLGILTILLPFVARASEGRIKTFADPIDALSVGVSGDAMNLEVSAEVNGTWTEWTRLGIEDEQDPTLRESKLVMFPQAVTHVRFRGETDDFTVHPIRISGAPITYRVASLGSVGAPRILTRAQWGADESLLFGSNTASSSSISDERVTLAERSDQPAQRVIDCQETIQKYLDEFRTVQTSSKDATGRAFLWPQSYSPSVRLLVIHHTAMTVTGETRSPLERMRALYQYHTVNRSWGDIGYHYVIDENGQIYEGRAGGDYVVGGHAYCHNVGSIGIALMGNFSVEQPTQAQTKSLQWLLISLSEKYGIDLHRSALFHGKTLPPIVGHRQLLTTDCPGDTLFAALDQIRQNVLAGDPLAAVAFLVARTSSGSVSAGPSPPASPFAHAPSAPQRAVGLFPVGGTEIQGRPGEQVLISLRYQTGAKPVQRRSSIGTIERRTGRLAVWEDHAGIFEQVVDSLFAPEFLNAGSSTTIRVKMGIPYQGGEQTVAFGDVVYHIAASGQRVRTPNQKPTYQVYTAPPVTHARTVRLLSHQLSGVVNPPPRPLIVTPASPPDRRGITQTAPLFAKSTTTIRILLRYGTDDASSTDLATVTVSGKPTVNGSPVDPTLIQLTKTNDGCSAMQGNRSLGTGIVRIDSQGGIATIVSWNRERNRFRGILECRVIAGSLVLINELPLEEYMAGIAEEDDREPYEKQRALAVAARTYATYYLDPLHRKFPGMPYDGSDSPASFQIYSGVAFEEKNPHWVTAVQDTSGEVLTKGGQIIRAAYFSSDDGRTRSPLEVSAGFASGFPFPEVFASKPDPWCSGMPVSGHGVGMSGCGASGQAKEGKKAEDILQYYYPGTAMQRGYSTRAP